MSIQKFILPIEELEVGMITGDFVSVHNERGVNVTLANPNTLLTESIIEGFGRYELKEIEVLVDNIENARLYAKLSKRKPVPSAPSPPPVSAPAPASAPLTPPPQVIEAPPIIPVIDDALKEEAVASIRNLFDLLGEGGNMTTAYQAVKELDNVVDQLVETISSESHSFVHIADLKSYDEYTYHHSLSVAVLAIAIGQRLGLNPAQLKKLGQCAIMHDIGKTYIPAELINKPGKLTNEEFTVVKGHAAEGGKYLEQSEIGDSNIWAGVTHHHEKLDGSGYPNGLKGNEIPLFSKIIAVADVYDAVTSYRSYRAPMPPSEAIELVMSEIGRSFEYNIVSAFVAKLELYPMNSVVQLSNRRLGYVVDTTNSMRPVLRMLDDGSTLDLLALDNLHLIISKIVS